MHCTSAFCGNDPYKTHGITLIALIITIILLLILAGITIHFTLGENGILRNAEIAVNKYGKAQAREKLQTALAYAEMQKNINKDYNSGEFLEKLLEKEKIKLVGNTASVDGYVFLIDREKLIIVEEIEEEPTKVQIAKVVTSYLGKKEDGKYYVKANVTIKSEEEIKSITVEGLSNIEVEEDALETTKELELEIGRKYKVITITKGGVTNTNTLIEEKEEKVSNVNELVELRNNVNRGLTYEGKILTQTQDIDLSSVCGEGKESWEPIGYNTIYFNGTYNGNGKQINNIYINNTTTEKHGGLFGSIGNNGEVKNVTISGTIINNVAKATGGVAGRSNGIIDNCVNNVNVRNNFMSVGGIVGNNLNTVKNCTNKGHIIGASAEGTGGIVGISGNSTNETINIEGCINSSTARVEGSLWVGGICGYTYGATTESKITKCTNEGTVIASESIVGGIVGSSTIDITNCKNKGLVTSKGNPSNPMDTQGTGGIAGRTTATIRLSSNEGTIKSNGFYAGGILGLGEESTDVGQCYNKGTIEAEQNAVGGIVGKNSNIIWNCYNYITEDKKIKGYCNVGGIMGTANETATYIGNCYSIGENIIGASNASIIGAKGELFGGLESCFCLDSTKLNGIGDNSYGSLTSSEIYKKSMNDFKLSAQNPNSVAYKLNQNTQNVVWSQEEGINDGYPYLMYTP